MTSVVLVHGIGVRGATFEPALSWLRDGLAQVAPEARLIPCVWGDDLGASLPPDLVSFWTDGSCSGDAGVSVDSLESTALWSFLDDDPLFEVRIIASAGRPRSSGPAGGAPAGADLVNRTRALPNVVELLALLSESGLAEAFPGAVDAVLDNRATKDALSRAGELPGEIGAVLARALVAATMRRAGHADQPIPLDGARVAALVEKITVLIGPRTLVPGARLGRYVVTGLANQWAQRRKAMLTVGVTPYAGDVARYLVHGDELRARIRAAISAAPPPVVLVGHSLGGVACLDLLTEPAVPAVRALVTVGSQAAYLHGIDALPSRRQRERLPAGFPRWLNVYDRQDLLSFAAEMAFPGLVADRRVDNRAPFPRAHSAYFCNPEVHAVLGEALR